MEKKTNRYSSFHPTFPQFTAVNFICLGPFDLIVLQNLTMMLEKLFSFCFETLRPRIDKLWNTN